MGQVLFIGMIGFAGLMLLVLVLSSVAGSSVGAVLIGLALVGALVWFGRDSGHNTAP